MRKTESDLPIVSTGFREPLQGNLGVKFCLCGAIDFAQTFSPDLCHYLVIPNDLTDRNRYSCRPNTSEIKGLAFSKG